MAKKQGNPGLRGQLLSKSIEAYILALETINRLSITYRIETFAYLICNAWELLLKAKILSDANNYRKAIYYKRSKGQQPRSLALRDCLDKVFLNASDPIRRNVEWVAELRDEAVHFVISHVPKEVLALFQASVLNYHRCLSDWFSISLSDRVTVGMMTIVYDFSPEEFDLNNPRLRRKMGCETANFLMGYQAKLQQEFETLGKQAEFSISIDYKLTLVKSGNPDIQLVAGIGGCSTGILEVPKDSSKTHPHRQKEVLEEANRNMNGLVTINQHDIQCILKVHGIKKRTEFYYQGTVPGSPAQYSQAFVDWILKQHQKNSNFFSETRQKAKQMHTTSG
jgi:hypothetical protein